MTTTKIDQHDGAEQAEQQAGVGRLFMGRRLGRPGRMIEPLRACPCHFCATIFWISAETAPEISPLESSA